MIRFEIHGRASHKIIELSIIILGIIRIKRTNELREQVGRTNRQLLRCLTMAAPMDEARLAILGHQEHCSRGDSVTALSGAQTLRRSG